MKLPLTLYVLWRFHVYLLSLRHLLLFQLKESAILRMIKSLENSSNMRNLYKNVVCLQLVSGKLQVSMNLNFFNTKSTSSTVLLMPNNAHFSAKEYFSCCRMNFLTSSHLVCLLLHQIRFPNYYALFLRLLFVVFIFFFFQKKYKINKWGRGS